MRWTLLIALGSLSFGQSLVEHSAAAAGGSVGGVAGKKVSDGLSAIFQKVDQHTAKAAKGAAPAASPSASASEPLFEVGPAVPKQKASFPPPPPPVHRAAAVHKAPLPTRTVRVVTPPVEVEQPAPVASADLRTLRSGMSRGEVLKLGAPSARITMYDDGHLLEIYRYVDRETDLGTVRLMDGAVSSVQFR